VDAVDVWSYSLPFILVLTRDQGQYRIRGIRPRPAYQSAGHGRRRSEEAVCRLCAGGAEAVRTWVLPYVSSPSPHGCFNIDGTDEGMQAHNVRKESVMRAIIEGWRACV